MKYKIKITANATNDELLIMVEDIKQAYKELIKTLEFCQVEEMR